MVVNEQGWFLTQRQYPEMALITAEVVEASTLRLTVPGQRSLDVPVVDKPAPGNRALTVQVWNDRCEAVDQGEVAAELLSDYLGVRCRLVRMAESFRRELGSSYPATPGITVGFADSSPLMLASERSLDELNGRLEEPIRMDRFRPNIVVSGGSAYQEDRWSRIRIGDVTMRLVKDCIRCQIINVDQQTGQRGIEPLETLGAYRSGPRGPRFGRKVVHEHTGSIRPGDPVEVLEVTDPDA